MATQETQQVDSIIASRRALLMGGGALATLALTGMAKAAVPATFTDLDILNFALNLEYLEGQFYTLATEGLYLDQTAIGTKPGVGAGTTQGASTSITVKTKTSTSSNTKLAIAPVPFTSTSIAAYAFETALEERKHVVFLRTVLGSAAAAQPNLDLVNSFIGLGALIGVPNFDPFANDLNFLLGAYIFEDVGVSAYHGAAALIKDKVSYLGAAASIQAVEGYHAGLVRSAIAAFDAGLIVIPGETRVGAASGLTVKISNVRATVDGTSTTATPDDIGVLVKNVALNTSSATFPSSTTANTDANYIAWSRSFRQVLNIVYATPGAPTSGGFFPNGLSGNIS